MLRECPEHGYFRGEICPVCGDEGKFLMSDEELSRISKAMAGSLRHFPEKFELQMDEQGFVSIQDFIFAMKKSHPRYRWLRPHHIIALIETDEKGRYQISNDKMRATYGHTLELNLQHPTDDIPAELFYPTTPEEEEIILETGLKPSDRKMVHLSKTYEDALTAGKVRTDSPAILKIDATAMIAAGMEIQHAAKTVFLTKEVPPEYLTVAGDE
ncbi:RNA 2'-phosphotransferase [Candidatus Methanomassiliicoccus intestinalis]|uniref:RNA 2'-phosphotransferase n=1 Tax=Candidatus Methanomassiliicoccus intestinalis TaxID=1406512 RepID=UPI0037DCA987